MAISKGAGEGEPLEAKMSSKSKPPEIPIPKGWDAHVKFAILHIIALAQYGPPGEPGSQLSQAHRRR